MLSRQKQEEYKEKRAQQNFKTAKVQRIDEDSYLINNQKFKLTENVNSAFDEAALSDRYMNVLDQYDFVVGDWSFEQLRLKGFYTETVKKVPHDKYISHLPDYLIEFCSFGCAYFILEHERSDEEREKRDKQLNSINQNKPKPKRQVSNRKPNIKGKTAYPSRAKTGNKATHSANPKTPISSDKGQTSETKKPRSNQPKSEPAAANRKPASKQFQIHDKKKQPRKTSPVKPSNRNDSHVAKTIVTKNGANPKIKTRNQGDA